MMMAELCFAVGAVFRQQGKRDLQPDITGAQLAIYMKAVCDVPAAIVRAAMQHLATTHKYNSLPNAGALRAACAAVALGTRMTSGEAWEKVIFLLRRISTLDWERSKQLIAERSTEDINAVVASIGWIPLQNMPAVDGRRWFMQEWDKRGETERQRLLIPGLWPGRLSLPAVERQTVKALPGTV